MSASSGKAKHHRADSSNYTPVYQDDDNDRHDDSQAQNTYEMKPPMKQYPMAPLVSPPSPPGARYRVIAMASCIVILVAANLYLSLPYAFAGYGYRNDNCPVPPDDLPQYFRTSPNLWPGPTATGAAAFLAQTRVFDPTATFVPNEPLQTSMPIEGMKSGNESIFRMMAFLSPYSPSPGFGVDEYPLPEGAEITQVQMLSRHGSRYPTSGSDVVRFGKKVADEREKATFKGALAFIQDWKYELGHEILVPKGRQELYDSGVLHNYMYGKLYNPSSKIIVRTTTQDRMLKSAENWLAGFFGLDWRNNATIEVLIEGRNYNNSLAGYLNCPNSFIKSPGLEAPTAWINVYLKDAVSRFNAMSDDFEWTAQDAYAAQTMCPYETVAYGFSKFCDLFTYEEWQHFGYSIDLSFSSTNAFHSPTGRAIGLGYQQEVMARLKNHTLGYSGSQINVTLDNNLETFPLNQSLYFDFSHDTNIVSVLTAFGLRQFADELPATEYPGDRNFSVSHITPFGARLDMEIIKAPQPVSPHRDGYLRGNETRYIHFVLNQRTVPLGQSFPECDVERRDGWCELDTFIKIQDEMAEKAQYDFACFGDYEAEPYGKVTDGVPNRP
ncbi:3-phytase A precursor [Beauveria brongniartii RCEF 3172]|uniref:3-phytase n=1 Tax=Beauveria brongniartii RCEF 3172 TaxID=1081107 RepID=A0A166YUK6_9HYPO|nr:3-phytase A precursor [Beauveria brongniartii RCEF 3172]